MCIIDWVSLVSQEKNKNILLMFGDWCMMTKQIDHRRAGVNRLMLRSQSCVYTELISRETGLTWYLLLLQTTQMLSVACWRSWQWVWPVQSSLNDAGERRKQISRLCKMSSISRTRLTLIYQHGNQQWCCVYKWIIFLFSVDRKIFQSVCEIFDIQMVDCCNSILVPRVFPV